MIRIFYTVLFSVICTIADPVMGQKVATDFMKLSTFADHISQENIYKHLQILSSDEMEGREAGHPGNLKAARYLAEQLQEYGYESPARATNYFQYFPMYKQVWKQIKVTIDQQVYDYLTDFYALHSENPNLPSFKGSELVYLGYGMNSVEYNDFQEGDLANRIVIIREGRPESIGGVHKASTGLEPDKLQAARNAGVRLVLVIADRYAERLNRYRQILPNPTVSVQLPRSKRTNVLYISPRMANQIMQGYEAQIRNYDNVKYSTPAKVIDPVVIRKNSDIVLHKTTEYEYVPNVVGFLPGKDPELRNELLVISAHLDHLGMDGEDIYNGADDDGSGVSTVLEIARVISETGRREAGEPRRSLLILFANGEEKGLLGSAYYTDHPLYPLSSTITNLNVDMIGRRDATHQDNPYYTYIIGSDKLSSDLHEINEEVNQSLTNLELDYTYNDEADPNRFYYRSDHYNFAKNDIPVIFYFTGVHEDYHKPTDTIDKIEFPKMRVIGQLIFGTAWELLNRDARPAIDQK